MEAAAAGVAEGAPRSAGAWHVLPEEAVLGQLGASRAGLSPQEARARRARHGPNELRRSEGVSPLRILIGQFKGLIVGVLFVAAAVSALLGEWADATAIVAIVVLNGIIGFHQEYGAERAIAALRRMTAPTARVRRGGRSVQVPAGDVVPGDVLELEAGDVVAADARLIRSSELAVGEAALTGESEPVRKHTEVLERADTPLAERRNLVFLGTSVASGSAEAVVVATGMETEFGRIVDLLATAESGERTPLQERLESLGRTLVWASLALVAAVFAVGLARGMSVLELFLTSVSLAVAAVPEGMPAIVTVALALGVQRMARRQALVRRLHAVETLGSTEVVCSDKTGTLTVGEMTVRALWIPDAEYRVTGEGYAPKGEILDGRADARQASERGLVELLEVVAGCNAAALVQEGERWTVVGDPTEGALLAAAWKGGLTPADVERRPALVLFPFDSDRKRMSVVRQGADGRRVALCKGAPDVLLDRCTSVLWNGTVERLTADRRDAAQARTEAMAERGLRVLAAARRELRPGDAMREAAEVEQDLTLVGLVGMVDPPRPEARDAVGRAHRAGLRVVMITGDHPRTAGAIARELGIARASGEVLSGNELDGLDDARFADRVRDFTVYARVTAAHKLRIVRAWKARGAVVAMTGDGVNDAPAIRGADVGIAMGRTGTEVTKEASDMVITDDNFASIVAAVEQGRGTFDNIRKTLQYLLSGNAGELLLMTVAVGAGLPLPLMPVQLLWINLVTDGLPALCLATDPIDRGVMDRRPRPRTESIMDRPFVVGVVATGTLTAAVALAVYAVSLRRFPIEMARAHAFTVLVFAELLRSFGARSRTRAVWRDSPATNLKLLAVVLASLALQLSLPHAGPLGALLEMPAMPMSHCLVLLASGAVPLVALEFAKVVRAARSRP